MDEVIGKNPRRGGWYNIGKRLRRWINRVIALYSIVGDPPVFDPHIFPWTSVLEANWRVIREEVDALLEKTTSIPTFVDVSPDQYRIANTDKWRSFFLWGFGYKVEANARRCPKTVRILEGMPDLVTAFFSILQPGIHIPRHRGVSKRIINFHLALKVPSGPGDCRIAVADRVLRWQEGKCIAFDDTFQHEVWNDTSEVRVVLLLQFKRPIRWPGRFLGDLFLTAVRLSPYVQEARRNIDAWENVQQQMEKS